MHKRPTTYEPVTASSSAREPRSSLKPLSERTHAAGVESRRLLELSQPQRRRSGCHSPSLRLPVGTRRTKQTAVPVLRRRPARKQLARWICALSPLRRISQSEKTLQMCVPCFTILDRCLCPWRAKSRLLSSAANLCHC
ncbi:hypothetical protein PFLUV_G00007860 [Perca fluviatilis]|uniref:Uncharacterized protein n=1 Tax=Perca fluviatilis TaxID=8168 RepID=A0A6A5FRJ7_PERFL|nr:hypothetical protein PFLUV_G00007860 [Perca fluviatilis]